MDPVTLAVISALVSSSIAAGQGAAASKRQKKELAATPAPQATLGEDKSRRARASIVDSFPWKDIKTREIPTAEEIEQLTSPVYTT